MENNLKTTDLAEQKCLPCRGGVEPLTEPALTEYMRQLSEGWHIIEERRLKKGFTFKNFADALAFVNKVGRLAEQLGHHPDVFLAWGRVDIQLWTHKINGLHENDFILAAHIDRL